jgi:LysM repeat protein
MNNSAYTKRAYTKRVSVAALVLGVAVGCATSPQEEQMTETCEGISPDVQAAIDEAESANADARAMGADWRDAREMINRAESAGEDCNDDQAMQYANEAKMMAQNAVEAYRQEQQEAEAMAEEEQAPSDRQYTVSRGDTLWGIAGRPVGYNDPYMWPLIYRANQAKIRDPDLIYPGETFTIEAEPKQSAVSTAVEHAKTRGEWSLGEMEASDMEYLEMSGGM